MKDLELKYWQSSVCEVNFYIGCIQIYTPSRAQSITAIRLKTLASLPAVQIST